ncbi:MAG: type III-B CRISPR module-associated protein Cmr5 [Acidobacteriota bacterium]
MEYQPLARERARQAWNAVSSFHDRVEAEEFKKYRSLIRNFPSMMQTMGVGATLAFLQSKPDSQQHKRLLKQLHQWAFQVKSIPWRTPPDNFKNEHRGLLCRLLKEPILDGAEQAGTNSVKRHALEQAIWWAVEEELLAYGIWLKRFTESYHDETKAKKEKATESGEGKEIGSAAGGGQDG